MTALATRAQKAKSVPSSARSELSAAQGGASGQQAPIRPGPRIYNLFPLLVGTVRAWSAELPRIAAMGFDWVYLNPFHEAGFSGSLYAVKDVTKLDPRFRDDGAGSDDDQIRAFVDEAGRHGLRVMTDLVVNHASKDAVLASERRDAFLRYPSGELASPYAVDPDDPTKKTVWGDLAEFDYENPASREFLTGYWDAYIGRMQGLGVGGFRCDAAYKVPPAVWRALIGSAKARDPDCLFAAETLGCTFDETKATARPGFDYLFQLLRLVGLPEVLGVGTTSGSASSRALLSRPREPRHGSGPRRPPALTIPAPGRPRPSSCATRSRHSSRPRAPAVGFEGATGARSTSYENHARRSRGTRPGSTSRRGFAAVNRLRAELGPVNVEGAGRHMLRPTDAPYLALCGSMRARGGAEGPSWSWRTQVGEAAVRSPRRCCADGGLSALHDRTPDSVPSCEPGGTLTSRRAKSASYGGAGPGRRRAPRYRAEPDGGRS
jgi:starch synthase (maltosyl-transferring)